MSRVSLLLSRFGNVGQPSKSLIGTASMSALIPSFGGSRLKNLPKKEAFILTFSYVFVFALTFSLLLWNNATTSYAERFLSLNSGALGTDCQEVPLPVSGTFEATSDGIWQTQRGFSFNRSTFSIDLSGAELTNSDYHAGMTHFAQKLSAMGARGVMRNVLNNLIVWATFSFKYEDMLFTSTADAAYIFDATIGQSAMTSIKGVCAPMPNNRLFPCNF